MQEETAILTYKIAIALFGGAGIYFFTLWVLSKFLTDYSDDTEKDPPVFPKREDFINALNKTGDDK